MERNRRVSEARAAADVASDETERIRTRAYELFLERSETGSDGSEFLDWVAAEAEILARRRAKALAGDAAPSTTTA